MTEANFSIVVKLFAAYQEAVGAAERDFQVTPGTTVADIRDRLIAEYPDLEAWRSQTRFGVNLEFVEADTVLQLGDELVLIPPVSGG